MLEGQINAALRFVSESSSGGVLPLTDDVMVQLKEKHPNPQPTKLGSLLFGFLVSKETLVLRRWGDENKSLFLSKELINVELPP